MKGPNLLRFLKPKPMQSGETLRREMLANTYIRGNGIEIGALHKPLPVPSEAQVKYLDRMSVTDLKTHYPEMKDVELLEPDIVDDGERLTKVADDSQDFVIANHFLEHCETTLLALENMLRVLKPGGVLFLAVPDMRYTFDRNRPVTPLSHLIQDYREGPEATRRDAYHQWATLVDGLDEETAKRQIAHYMDIGYSIHFHVWTQKELFEILQYMRYEMGIDFDVEAFFKNNDEMIFILRKAH